jgi:glycosyltransferase involved in cell wall biosynthesis
LILNIGLNACQFQHNNSGIGQYIKSLYFYLIPLLDKRPDIEKIYVYMTKDAPELKLEEKASKLKIVRLPINCNPVYKRALFQQLVLPLNLLKDKIDIYFVPDSRMPIGFLRKTKVVAVIHDMCAFRWPQEYKHELFKLVFWRWSIKRTIKRADKVIAISEFTKSEIDHFSPGAEAKIIVIYNGVDKRFKPELNYQELLEVIDRYTLPDKYIMFIGQASPRKNLKTLLVALGRIKDSYPDLKLLIVGMSGWKDDQDIKLVKQLNLYARVLFPGYILDDDLPAVYKLAQLTVCPSLYEGFGLPPVESMACGTICVATNSSSIPEVTGGYAELVDPTVDALACGITKMLNLPEDEKHRVQQEGINYVKRFLWEKTARQVYELINDLR